jgi:hypothetical protein
MKRTRWGLCLGGWLMLGAMSGPTRLPAAETNSAPTVRLTDDQLADRLQAAILLARVGLYDEAEEDCQRILAQKPDHPAARQLLSEIQQKQRDQPGDLRRRLKETVIPEISVRETPVIDVIVFLREQSRKLSPDKTPLNLVWQAPEESKAVKVTLNLRQIPLADALRYLTEIAGLRYRVDPHAVVIYKPLPTAPNAGPG